MVIRRTQVRDLILTEKITAHTGKEFLIDPAGFCKFLDESIKDEEEAVKTYHGKGIDNIARDEQAHKEILVELRERLGCVVKPLGGSGGSNV